MTTHVMNLLLVLKRAALSRPPDGWAESITFEVCRDTPVVICLDAGDRRIS
jgi:hypothetical protein